MFDKIIQRWRQQSCFLFDRSIPILAKRFDPQKPFDRLPIGVNTICSNTNARQKQSKDQYTFQFDTRVHWHWIKGN